ncbi:response regulator [Paucidesulfovibrio longus]|uniref:response regulator n=1 Tax=Paucidesulfovibrio longus TaxID=889 RepID=UPI0003B6B2E0|nr:response regulator [Paucidesulfovibrio longus]
MNTHTATGTRPRLRISHKLTLAFFLFAAAISALTTFAFYEAASRQVMNDIRHRLRDVVGVAVSVVDVEDYQKLHSPDQDGSPEFLAVRSSLQKVRDAASDVKYIYTLDQLPDGTIRFVVDGESDPDDAIPLFQPYDDASPLLRERFAGLNEPLVENAFYTDEWGSWLSGYAPFYDADGKRLGVLGVDISAETVALYKAQLLNRALAIFGLTLPLILFAGAYLGKRIGQPIIAIKEGAERIGQGDLDTRVQVDSNDEVGILAESLNQMAEKLAQGRRELSDMVEQYRNIFENASEGIYQSTMDGRLITANTALVRMLGFETLDEFTSEIRSLGERVYVNAEDRRNFLLKLREEGRVEGMRLKLRRRDGVEFWVEDSAHYARSRTGETIIEGMVQDISARMERERAEQERRAAEAASQAKSEFLANMSHEIRTPLNAVMGLTDLLMRTEGTPRQMDYFRKIKSSSQTLLSVINDILDFSKIEAGRLELEEVRFSLYEVMANISEMFSHKAHEHDVELLVSIAEGTPCALVGDPVRLGQVLINLTGNALKFTKQGEVLVEVRPAELPADASGESLAALEFAVRDTGIGIAPDRLDTIFDSFTQADSSTTRKFGGTGLGLSICKQITRLMGGSIRAESRGEGTGSSFVFTAVFRTQPSENEIKHLPPKDLRGLRVLIVDDNSTARGILAAAVNSFHMEAHTADSGQKGLEMMAAADPPYDLVLLDWKMPELNGLETAKRIKRDLKLDKTPIVCMVSAYGREDLIQQAEKSFLDAFLHKPVNQSFLFDTIMELFGRNAYTVSGGQPIQADELKPAEHLAGADVLLVEDNEINREVAGEWLRTARMRVRIAENGLRALEALAPDAGPLPDVVLMDIQMPELDGLEATRRLRRDPRLAKLPIIAMTAHALKGDRERCLEAGMNDYVTKPIDPRQLFTALANWVEEKDRTPAEPPCDPEQADATCVPSLPDALPGIALQDGLFRANNNVALYRKLLRTFLRDFSGTQDRMRALLARSDADEARLLAHSIKGVAGNIGAANLSALAAEVETALKSHALETDSQLWDDFTESLEQVLSGLREAALDTVPAPGGADAAVDVDRDSLLAELEKIEPLLDDDLDEARNALERLSASLGAAAGAELRDNLLEQIDNFEIDEALETVKAIRAVLAG